MDIEKYEFSDDHFFKGHFHFNTVEFIKEYEKYPCLWNKFHPNFKNRIERDKAEAQLMVKFGFISNISLRRKIRSIRGTYNTEIRRMKRENDYEPKLSWFPQADKFLRTMIDDSSLSPSVVIISPDELDDEMEDAEYIYVGRGDTNVLDDPIESDTIETEVKHNIGKDDQNEAEEHRNKSNDFRNFVKEKEKHLKVNMKAYKNIVRKSKHAQENSIRKSMKSIGNRPIIQRPKFTRSARVIENVDAVGKTASISSCDIFSNEFIAFGTSVALQLQQMPLEVAIETQSAIQTLISNARLRYLRMNKEFYKSPKASAESSSMRKLSLHEGRNRETCDNFTTDHEQADIEEIVSLLE